MALVTVTGMDLVSTATRVMVTVLAQVFTSTPVPATTVDTVAGANHHFALNVSFTGGKLQADIRAMDKVIERNQITGSSAPSNNRPPFFFYCTLKLNK